jgi:hypothetical protein
MRTFEPGELIWFVHPTHGVGHALGFIRDHKSGAYIYGGRTGSHYTGHGEPWTKKLAEIQSLGYLLLPAARLRGVVPHDWQPPAQDAQRDIIVRRIRGGEL